MTEPVFKIEHLLIFVRRPIGPFSCFEINKSMQILVLDDSPARLRQFAQWLAPMPFESVNTADQAYAALQNTLFDLVFLDHDLGEDEKTGSDLTRRWLANRPISSPRLHVVLHTSSEAGAALMRADLRRLGIVTIRMPYYQMTRTALENLIEEVRTQA